MKFRCPYCKKTFNGEPRSICPYCGKTMMMPDHLIKTSSSEEKRKARTLRDLQAERELKAIRVNDFKFGNKPSNLILIIAIMVIIGGMLTIRTKSKIQPHQEYNLILRAENELRALHLALDCFYKDCGCYPSTDEGLKALVINPGISNWGGNYINLIKPDPWKHRYFYSFTNGRVTLFSFGPDGIKGNADDLAPEIRNAKEKL